MTNTFPGFPYQAEDLSAYALCLDIFVISLHSREVIRFSTPDTEAFHNWLRFHKVRDVATGPQSAQSS